MKSLRSTFYFLRTSRKGFTFIELLLVIGITAIMAGFMLFGLVGKRSSSELSTTAERIVALLREAQSRSVGQASSTTWGVRFSNGTEEFYALFGGTYSTSSREQYYALPAAVDFATSSVASSSSIDVTFAQLSGASTGSTTVKIYLIAQPNSSTTITIDPSGAVSY